MGRPLDAAALAGHRVVVWGCAGHAAVLLDLLAHCRMQVCAFLDQQATEPLVPGVPVFAREQDWLQWHQAQVRGQPLYGVAAIGRQGGHRQRVQAFFESHGVALPVLVHPHATVSPQARLGHGVQVLAGAIVAARAQLGDMCIVNHRASVDHECVLAPGVMVAPGATLCGSVRVGEDAFIGAGATVLPRLSVGAGAMVGAGAVVTRDVAPGAVVCGNPARRVKEVHH
jgi:sugar O-acyltransferase (sialic acid O-acetyltransferase NeuD family)